MSVFDKINQATQQVNRVGSLVNQGAQVLGDIVGPRKAPTDDYESQRSFLSNDDDDEDEDESVFNSSPSRPVSRRKTDLELRRMAETKGNMVFVLMKTVSSAFKSLISRILISKNTDEEVSEIFARLSDMAENEGVNVYQFVPSEEQMLELGITDKNLLLNEGKKAEKKRNLLKALEEETPDIDEVFKQAVIESLFNRYKEEDERGELKTEGLMDVIVSYSMVSVVGVFSNSGYNIIDMVLDLFIKKKPIINPSAPKVKTNGNENGKTIEELAGDRDTKHGQNTQNDDAGQDSFESGPTLDSI